MESILDRILSQRHAQEIRGFHPVEVLQSLLAQLSDRERQVVIRRFGLPPADHVETLEEIGKRLEVTRERIRQISKTSVVRLAFLGEKHEEVQRFARVAEHLLRSYGGALEEKFFIAQLLQFASIPTAHPDRAKAEVCLIFLLDEVVAEAIAHVPANALLQSSYAVHGVDTALLKDAVAILVSSIEDNGLPMSSDDLIKKFKESPLCRERYRELVVEPVHISREFFASPINPEAEPEHDEESRVILAYAAAARELDQNIFGQWGKRKWTSIRPRRMNDKIYLILQQEKKPLHFTDIAARINDAKFDSKVAKPPSVHNELILDKRFVLVGRGLYALREWGYEPGTVADVIAEVLKGSEGMERPQIVDEVLRRRLVKKQTIHLTLMNKDKFEKLSDGRYRLLPK